MKFVTPIYHPNIDPGGYASVGMQWCANEGGNATVPSVLLPCRYHQLCFVFMLTDCDRGPHLPGHPEHAAQGGLEARTQRVHRARIHRPAAGGAQPRRWPGHRHCELGCLGCAAWLRCLGCLYQLADVLVG